MEGVYRKAEGDSAIEMDSAAHDDPTTRAQHGGRDHDGNDADRSDIPVQQRRIQQAERHCDQDKMAVLKNRDKKACVLAKADSTRRNGDWADQERLPEEEEADQAPPALWAKGLQKVMVGTTGAGERRTKLC